MSDLTTASPSSLPSGDELRDAAAGVHDQTVELRRAIHAEPELGLQLPDTQAKILEALTGLGLDVTTGTSTTSVVAELDTGVEGPTVLLRADMDALPMTEDLDVPFQSKREGRMHACGHDGHVSMLASAARILADHKNDMTGKIRFMFQPGEEGFHGAKYMIEEGITDGVDRAFAIHVSPNAPAGSLGTRRGPLLASADRFELRVLGKGGHASMPHFAVDPIPAGAAIITGIHTMVGRTIDVNQPGLVTVAHMEAGTTNNVIPETAFIEGTIRSLNERSREALRDGVTRVAENTAAAHQCGCKVDIVEGYPVTVNDAYQADLVGEIATHTLGEDNFREMPTPVMGAEDWSYVLQRVPGAMAMLGVCPDDVADPREAPGNHSNYMRLNEDALANGVAMYCAMAMAR